VSVAICPNGHQSASTDYCDTCGAPITGAGGDAGGAGASGSGGGAAGAVAPSGPPTGAPSAPQICPNCQTDNLPDALFCEACGYDFTTGAMPRTAAPTSALDVGAGGVSGGSAPAEALGAAAPAGAPGAAAPAGAPGAAAPAGAPGPAPLAPKVPLEWVVEAWVDPDWYAQQDSDEPCPSPGLPAIVPLTVRSVLIGRVSKSRNIHPEVDCSPDIGVSRRHAQLTTDGTRWWIEDLQSSNGTYVGSDSGPLPTEPLVPGNRRELAEGDRVYVGAWTRLVVRRATADETAAHV
jgi:hypothetical protein